jgi:hypothetical protein
MRHASLEDSQLLAESKILQRDLFAATKDQKNHPKKREDCVQHETGSVLASSLKINRLRERWDLARDGVIIIRSSTAEGAEQQLGANPRIQTLMRFSGATPVNNTLRSLAV